MHAQILDSVYVQYRDESVVEVLRGLCGTGILIAFIDPTDGSWSDDLMASDNKWRPMIDAVLYSCKWRNSKMADILKFSIFHTRKKYDVYGVKDAKSN